MAVNSPPDADLPELVDALLASYAEDPRAHHLGRKYLPSREEILRCIEILLALLYPGYFGRRDLSDRSVRYEVGVLLGELRATMARQVSLCLSYEEELGGCAKASDFSCEGLAITTEFLRRLPALRRMLIADVQAAYDGDPAATNLDEIILAYPGMLAVTVYRIAHELHVLGVPLMPRIMTEWAHAQTGADIHPAAELGPSFFLDHATGVVIGETTKIGAHVKLYQGVTLGAISHPKDERGRVIRERKRHPTVEDGVTVYANATVLGGETTLGEGAIVGGSVFLTQSVPPNARVAVKPPELSVRQGSAWVQPRADGDPRLDAAPAEAEE